MASGVKRPVAKKALNNNLYSTTDGDSHLYIPLAVHKNELVVIDSMEAFSHYFCLAKKQKMTPLACEVAVARSDEDMEEEGREYFDEGIEVAAIDEDDEL
ncbi:hypothetical protein [Methanocella arvoryzae]|uniref:hypothetical protein n=1 Tax=Methanocella arvoryzae TaxID=1175445 RepID=UPI0011D299A4|nr:hypothetical protein [Methanocella arvoryzae]